MKNHTTLRIGGPAQYFAEVSSREEIRNLIKTANENRIPFMAIGAGSNVLIGDKGFEGIVFKLIGQLADCSFSGNELEAGGGAYLPVLVNKCSEKGLAGIDSLAGIPGTIGGALVSNAGTRSGCIGDITEYVLVMDEKGNETGLKKKDLKFSYRASNLEGKIVLNARFSLKKEQKNDILKRISESLIKRSAAQPLDAWSVGSIFKNPEGDSAGRLIEAAGMKGMRFGGALVSEKHANFIVNTGSATASDMRNLIASVRRSVSEKFGKNLELEIKIIGD